MAEELAMTQETIRQIRAAQQPIRRQYNNRPVKVLSHTGILTTRDNNRSIKTRREAELAKEERKLARQYKKVHGYTPTQRSEESIQQAMANEIAGREAGDLSFIDK
jgi:hypothetical protein